MECQTILICLILNLLKLNDKRQRLKSSTYTEKHVWRESKNGSTERKFHLWIRIPVYCWYYAVPLLTTMVREVFPVDWPTYLHTLQPNTRALRKLQCGRLRLVEQWRNMLIFWRWKTTKQPIVSHGWSAIPGHPSILKSNFPFIHRYPDNRSPPIVDIEMEI